MTDSFSAYSWEVLSDSVAVKRMDKSSFLHGGTGVPKEVAFFFDLPEAGLTESKSITLEVDGSKYDAHIEMDATLARFRLFWKSDLSDYIKQRFPQYHELYQSEIAPDSSPHMRFQRVDADFYAIQFLDSSVPTMNDCDIHAIAEELNARSVDYEIGGLQDLRKTIKHFSRRPGKYIFSKQTTHDDWACHHGGRSELQFNIGKDGSGGSILRHGIAFSFETTQTLPTIEPLKPKVRLFNDYLQLYPETYAGMSMWHFEQNNRIEYPPNPIPSERVKEGLFIFLGKRFPIEQLDYERILNDFDRLLPLYRYVESNGSLHPTSSTDDVPFLFSPGFSSKPGQTVAHLAHDQIDVTLRHNVMQELLYNTLASKYGAENVGTELPSGVGTRVDVVVQHSNSFWFYEIKTAHSPRACIRQAIGQLLEYSYWPKAQEAAKLIIVGETPLDAEGEAYLSLLNERFSLPIEYEHVVLSQ